jgi:hypothetical protein
MAPQPPVHPALRPRGAAQERHRARASRGSRRRGALRHPRAAAGHRSRGRLDLAQQHPRPRQPDPDAAARRLPRPVPRWGTERRLEDADEPDEAARAASGPATRQADQPAGEGGAAARPELHARRVAAARQRCRRRPARVLVRPVWRLERHGQRHARGARGACRQLWQALYVCFTQVRTSTNDPPASEEQGRKSRSEFTMSSSRYGSGNSAREGSPSPPALTDGASRADTPVSAEAAEVRAYLSESNHRLSHVAETGQLGPRPRAPLLKPPAVALDALVIPTLDAGSYKAGFHFGTAVVPPTSPQVRSFSGMSSPSPPAATGPSPVSLHSLSSPLSLSHSTSSPEESGPPTPIVHSPQPVVRSTTRFDLDCDDETDIIPAAPKLPEPTLPRIRLSPTADDDDAYDAYNPAAIISDYFYDDRDHHLPESPSIDSFHTAARRRRRPLRRHPRQPPGVPELPHLARLPRLPAQLPHPDDAAPPTEPHVDPAQAPELRPRPGEQHQRGVPHPRGRRRRRPGAARACGRDGRPLAPTLGRVPPRKRKLRSPAPRHRRLPDRPGAAGRRAPRRPPPSPQ